MCNIRRLLFGNESFCLNPDKKEASDFSCFVYSLFVFLLVAMFVSLLPLVEDGTAFLFLFPPYAGIYSPSLHHEQSRIDPKYLF